MMFDKSPLTRMNPVAVLVTGMEISNEKAPYLVSTRRNLLCGLLSADATKIP